MAGRITAGPGRRLALPASVGVIGLALIGIGQLGPNRLAIQDDLTSRSTEALASADLVGLSVSFSGRDATITGAGTAELADQAEDVVAAVDGVRVAHADRTGDTAAAPGMTGPAQAVGPTEPAEPTEAADPTEATPPAETAKTIVLPVGFTLDAGTITVTGTVASKSAATDLIDAVEAAGNGWTVANRLQVNGSLTAGPPPRPGRLPAVTRLLAAAPIDGAKLVIQYNRGSVILRGTPPDAATERALLTAAAATVARKSTVIDGLDTP